jgi:hypothetical protein
MTKDDALFGYRQSQSAVAIMGEHFEPKASH